MLLAAVLTLDPIDETAKRSAVTARQVQRWFKRALQDTDAALFDALHEPNTMRAYTLSAVHPASGEHPAWLRITSLNADLSALLKDRLLPDCGEIVLDERGERARFTVRGADVGNGRGPFTPHRADIHAPSTWAGCTSYSELITAVMREDRPPLEIALDFYTCTSFRVDGPTRFKINLPLPVPGYIFKSHLLKWDTIAPAQLPVQVGDFFDYYVWVSYHRVRTVKAVFGGGSKGKTVGFAGRVEFGMATRDKLPDEMRADWRHYVDVVRLLSAFAFYAGTGIRTTHGLGQTLPVL
jgi:hypothetical protein